MARAIARTDPQDARRHRLRRLPLAKGSKLRSQKGTKSNSKSYRNTLKTWTKRSWRKKRP